MKAKLIDYGFHWDTIYKVSRKTRGLEAPAKCPESFKRKLMISMHSPLRMRSYIVELSDLPYWVSVHLSRHKIGVEHFVSTQREDLKGIPRSKLPQDALVCHTMHLNAESVQNMAGKRLCFAASPETRAAMSLVIGVCAELDPWLSELCVPQCVRQGYCSERFNPCGFDKTLQWMEARNSFVEYVEK